MISVHHKDCSTHEVHRRQNYDRRRLFGCVEQPEDWKWWIKDDGWSVLTSVHSRLIGTAESCRVDTCKPERPSWTWSAVWLAAGKDPTKCPWTNWVQNRPGSLLPVWCTYLLALNHILSAVQGSGTLDLVRGHLCSCNVGFLLRSACRRSDWTVVLLSSSYLYPPWQTNILISHTVLHHSLLYGIHWSWWLWTVWDHCMERLRNSYNWCIALSTRVTVQNLCLLMSPDGCCAISLGYAVSRLHHVCLHTYPLVNDP